MVVKTRRMSTEQITSFTNQLCSLQLRECSTIRTVMSVQRKDGFTRPTGDDAEHWTD